MSILSKTPGITVEDVARQLEVAPATLYRHIPGGRSAVREEAFTNPPTTKE